MKDLLLTARLFMQASDDFSNDPEMLKSCGNIPLKSKETSWRYFTLRDQLTELGLKIKKLDVPSAATPLQKAVYRWATWQQAASHTSALTLMCYSADSAVIMENLGEAQHHMFHVISKTVKKQNGWKE